MTLLSLADYNGYWFRVKAVKGETNHESKDSHVTEETPDGWYQSCPDDGGIYSVNLTSKQTGIGVISAATAPDEHDLAT